ncbi:MAG TPA: helix-hairpin-helix domain-containing protein, partial [Phycisphaerae bacterium]|nr:helix-hairpin-helix domain-containing protein [Phycisphaerae bacterium]
IEQWQLQRGDVDYDTDGMVVKINELDLRQKLGTTRKYPRWCIAYKYETDRARTKLKSVDFQVGRTGQITPVARFDSVPLGGTRVSNASLHNFDEIERLDVHMGDTVHIEKAGEIIPQVVDVVPAERPYNAPKITPPTLCPSCDSVLQWQSVPEGFIAYRCTEKTCQKFLNRILRKNMPSKCPACGGPVEQVDHLTELLCVNPHCVGILRESILFFAGRNQMDIDTLGPEIVDQLISSGLVKHVTDLYDLTKNELVELERMADKSAQNLMDAIRASKNRGLARLLAALGIRHVGGRAAEILADHFRNIDALMAAPADELQGLTDIGEKIAASVTEYFASKNGRYTIERLKAAGVITTQDISQSTAPQTLDGKTVVVTGTLINFTRQQAQDAIKAAGGRATSSVSASTSFVVAGENPGSKVDDAIKLGVDIIGEDEFIDRLDLKDFMPSKTPDKTPDLPGPLFA